MKMYRTMMWYIKIDEFEIIKETKNYIIYLRYDFNNKPFTVKEKKITIFYEWHKTRENAIIFLKDRQLEKIEECKIKLEKLEDELRKINKLCYNI